MRIVVDSLNDADDVVDAVLAQRVEGYYILEEFTVLVSV